MKTFWTHPLRYTLTWLISALLFASLVPYHILLFVWTGVSFLFPEASFHKLESCLFESYLKLVVFFFEHVTGVEVYVDGVIPHVIEKSIVISNHQCMVDWIIAAFVAVRQGMSGHVRYVAKNALKYYPLVGFGFGMHGGVFVRRDGHYNDKNMRKVLERLIKRKAPIFFLIYPEGTRFSPERTDVLQRSQEFAKKQGLQPLQQVLTPRIKAFDCALDSLKEYVDAVYDITLIYDLSESPSQGVRAESPTAIQFLNGDCKRIFISFKRIPILGVLNSISTYKLKRDCSQVSPSLSWMHERFMLKDALLQHFFRNEFSNSLIESDNHVTSVGFNSNERFSTSNWKRSTLSLTETLPAFVIYSLTHALFLCFPVGRWIYALASTIGVLVAMIYCHFCF